MNLPRPKYNPECAMWFYNGHWYDEDPTKRWEEDLEEIARDREERIKNAYGRRT